jgi:type IV pilus assembly protein PilW
MNILSKHTNFQTGMTLIELMLALAISSILMLGVASVYVSSKRGYNIGDNLSRQQENSRFSLELLVHDLRMAGYPKTFIQEPIVSATTTEGGGTANDTVTIQYVSPTFTDCLGQPLTLAANACVDDPTQICAINKYYIDLAPPGNTKNLYSLYCLGNGGATPDVVAENVTNLQLLYGIDTDTNQDGIANKYVTWSNVSATDRANIVSVRFALLSQTPNDVRKVSVSKTYALLGQNITVNDMKIHRMYSNTVLLRNRLQ